MFALGPKARRCFVAVALVVLATALATLPQEVRSEAGEETVAAAQAPPRPAPSAFVAVMPRRDPFAGGRPPAQRSVTTPVPGVAGLPLRAAFPPIAIPSPSVALGRVTAIVTGARPYALIEQRGNTRIVTVGEQVAGDRIIAIDIDGVHVAHGPTLSVIPPTPSPTGVR